MAEPYRYKEHNELIEQIRRYFPESEQATAIVNLDFIVQASNLRGQREAWQEIVSRQNGGQQAAHSVDGEV
jgi:hypothetical protein